MSGSRHHTIHTGRWSPRGEAEVHPPEPAYDERGLRRYDFRRPEDECLLWLPDAVAGAVVGDGEHCIADLGVETIAL